MANYRIVKHTPDGSHFPIRILRAYLLSPSSVASRYVRYLNWCARGTSTTFTLELQS